MEKRKEIYTIEFDMVAITFLAGFFLQGLFTEGAACLFSAIYGFLFCFLLHRKKAAGTFRLGCGSFVAIGILLCYFLTCLYGIDYGMGLIGAFRLTGLLFFGGILKLLEDAQRKALLYLLPKAGVGMVLFLAASLLIAPMRDTFFVAGRMGGFFQYPNVFALFCLVGYLIMRKQQSSACDERKGSGWKAITQQLILLLGIMLSGSRTVTILAIICVCLLLFLQKEERKMTIYMAGGILLLAVVYVLLSKDMQNMGRIMTTSLSASTLVGRVLYAKDAVRLLADHPFGMGYLGYYYTYKTVQTGVYAVRFVHNDWLQLMLDIGIIPSLLFFCFFVKRACHFKKNLMVSLAICVIGIHMCFDFDMEFVAMLYLLVLLLYENATHCAGERCVMPLEKCTGKVMGWVSISISLLSLLLGLAILPRFFGNPSLSAEWLPFYTEANEQVLAGMTDLTQAEQLADDMHRQNPYVKLVYDTRAALYYVRGEYDAMCEAKENACRLAPYDMENWNRYGTFLCKGIEQCLRENKQKEAVGLMERLAKLPKQIEMVRDRTDPLAYRIKDLPDFTLETEILKAAEETAQILE